MQLARIAMLTLIAVGWLCIPATANEDESPMSKLSFLVGDWAGSGVVQKTNAEPGTNKVKMFYEVRYKADGNILVLENALRNAPGENTGFHASSTYSVISHSKSGFSVRTYADNSVRDSKLTVADKKLSWRIPFDSLRWAKYDIDVSTKGVWNEICTMTEDKGVTYDQVYAITYRKVD